MLKRDIQRLLELSNIRLLETNSLRDLFFNELKKSGKTTEAFLQLFKDILTHILMYM